MDKPHKLRLGIPKGSLQDTTQKLFIRAGFDLRISGRSYYPGIDDAEIECILIRPQEMARYVGQGVLDCAITGLDWIRENNADVVELADLKAPWPNYGTVRWVMAAKEDSPFASVKDLAGRRTGRHGRADQGRHRRSRPPRESWRGDDDRTDLWPSPAGRHLP